MKLRTLIFALLVAVAGVCTHAQEAPSVNDRAHRLIALRCLECHGAQKEAGLDLRTRATALTGGESGPALDFESPLQSRIIHQVFNEEMPPKEPLTDAEVELLETWVKDGAAYPEAPLDYFAYTSDRRAGYDWWSLQPIQRPDLPEVGDPAWTENPVDAFILAALEAADLEPSGAADPATLIRRATYDLTGLPPTPEERDAFLQACADETGTANTVGDKAYAALIDRLLASPHYGERWGRHWLDVVRFGESTGFEVNHIVDELWPYRDYVIQSFNRDKPYDRFILEQIAGDSVDEGNVDVEVGMTFLVAGPHDIVGNQDAEQAARIRANTVDEMIRVTSESFLGLTVGCARCHDHKFDPIAAKDYYSMYATLAGVHHGSREIATPEEKQVRNEQVAPLNAERGELNRQINDIRAAIIERAKSKPEDYDNTWTRPAVDRTGTEETFDPVEAKHIRINVLGRDNDPNARTGYRLDEVEVWTAEKEPRNVSAMRNGGRAEGRNTVPGDFAEAYDPKLTIDEKFGASWIAGSTALTVTFAEPETVNRIFFSSDREKQLSPTANESTFIGEYLIEISNDGETWTEVANSHDRTPVNDRHRNKRYLDRETTDEETARIAEVQAKIREVDKQIREIPSFPRRYAGDLRKPADTYYVFLGGDPQRKGDPVMPSSLSGLKYIDTEYELTNEASERRRRYELAKWIASSENPLTPRVMVNRLWHYHFGTGIVSTPSDFGFMGEPASHPKLLDWLAAEFVSPTDQDADSWTLKRMHKLIMLSRTYRQSGKFNEKAAAIDGDARLLWRFPPRRLDAEEIRDTMLLISGNLDTRMGGPGFRLYDYLRDNVSTYVPLDSYGPETYRRSVYHQNVRAATIDLMSDFDSPDCALPAPRRVTTTSPLQALTLMNHQFTIDMAESIAANIESDPVDRAFEIVLARKPSADERAVCESLVTDHGVTALCRALLNTNEFVYLN